MKKLLVFTLLLATLANLIACKKEIPPELQSPIGETVHSPYADTDTERAFYLSVHENHPGIVYKDDLYFCDGAFTLKSINLPDGTTDSELFKSQYTSTSPCSDPMCTHRDLNCPAMMRHPEAEFLIDVTESNGQLPIIYYFRGVAGQDNLESGQGEIIRYDVASNQATQVAVSSGPIKQMMSYKDRLYFTTQTAKDQYQLNMVNKSGGSVQTISAGECYLEILGANSGGVYCNDEKGNIYSAAIDLKDIELIYTVKDAYQHYDIIRPGQMHYLVEGEYLYFLTDFETREFPWDDYGNTISFMKHSIRRVSLNNPEGDGEVVADEVFEYCIYGVYKGVLYYGPFDVETMIPNKRAESYCYSKGTIKGVRLDTLDTFNAVYDCGLNFVRTPKYYINDRCIIGSHTSYRDGVGFEGGGTVLYDFKTGAMYDVYTGAVYMKGTNAE